jgi:ketosteroid isomerase-like protein
MDIRATLKALCDAFEAHDLDRIMSFFADDCVLEMPRPASLGRAFRGPRARPAGAREPLRGAARRALQ